MTSFILLFAITCARPSYASDTTLSMAITADVKNQLFTTSHYGGGELIRLPLETSPSSSAFQSFNGETMTLTNTNGRAWTMEEHNRFLEGLELFPSGPWKEIAAHVGSRTTRQTMTHAQKYREKIARRKRGLRSAVKDMHSLKRRRHQHKTMSKTASPCSVAIPSRSIGKEVEAMDDYPSCLMPEPPVDPLQYHNNGIDSVQDIHLSSFAATLSDFDSLPISEEEIDLILEAATLQVSSLQTSSSSCLDDMVHQ